MSNIIVSRVYDRILYHEEAYLSSRQTALFDILNRRMFLDNGINMFTDPSNVVMQLNDMSKYRNDLNCSRKSTVDKILFDRSLKEKKEQKTVCCFVSIVW